MLNTSRLRSTPCSQVTRCLQWEVLPSHALTWSWGHFGRQGRHGGTESATDWEEEAAPTSWLPPPPPRPAREPPRPLQSVAPSSPPPSEPPSPPSCATARAPLRATAWRAPETLSRAEKNASGQLTSFPAPPLLRATLTFAKQLPRPAPAHPTLRTRPPISSPSSSFFAM